MKAPLKDLSKDLFALNEEDKRLSQVYAARVAKNLRIAEARNRKQVRLLERIADAMELTAIINAQVSVPEHVGQKLDPWRDDLLMRMADRYGRSVRRRRLRKDPAADGPNGATEPASGSAASVHPAPGDSHPPAKGAADSRQG